MKGSCYSIFALLAGGLFFTSCVTDDGTVIGNQPRESGVCAEYQELTCLARVICETDKSRGCKVCYCEPPYGANPQGDPTPNSNLPE